MINRTFNVKGNKLRYRKPEINEMSVNIQCVLCQSGNESMREYDYGSGGFEEE